MSLLHRWQSMSSKQFDGMSSPELHGEAIVESRVASDVGQGKEAR